MDRGRRLSYGGLLLAWLILRPTLTLAAEQPITLDVIRAALRDCHTSIHSISCKWRIWYTPTPRARDLGLDVYNGRSWGPQHFEWAQQGSRRLLISGPIPVEGFPPAGSWVSHDGRRAYEIDYDPDDPTGKRIRSILRTPDVSDVYRQGVTPACLIGLRITWADEEDSLLDFISREDARLLGAEEVEGHACRKVDCGTYLAGEQPLRLSVWFDPQFDFLPRRITVRNGSDGKPAWAALENPDWHCTYEVREFMQVEDGTLRRGRWFPREALSKHLHCTIRMRVDEAVINRPIAVSRFRPQPQFGTIIYDGPFVAGQPVRSSVHGGPRAVEALMKERLEQAAVLKYPVPPGATLVDAHERSGFSLSQTLFCGSLAMLVLALVWRIKAMGRETPRRWRRFFQENY